MCNIVSFHLFCAGSGWAAALRKTITNFVLTNKLFSDNGICRAAPCKVSGLDIMVIAKKKY